MTTVEYDAERESYAALADEMNDVGIAPWVESDWDERAVAEGKAYAEKHDLNWPPQTGDFDRFWEREQRYRGGGLR